VRDVVLNDGTTLRLRTPVQGDAIDIQALYESLSPESRYLRFHGWGRTDAVAREYAEADGVDRLALIARQGGRVVAAAAYDRLREPEAAEVAFTVADDFHGRGVASRMLEQLADIAGARGIRRFEAEVMADNVAMLRVFERAGFELRRSGGFDEVVVSFDVAPLEAVLERIEQRDHRAAVASLRPVMAPTSIAVVGAADEPDGLGAAVLANILDGGFRGVAAPVASSGSIVRSMRAARALDELPEVPELVIIALPAPEVLDVAEQAAQRGARALLVLSSGFADDGEEGREREERLLEIVRSAGLRLVGPNCLGVLNTDAAVRLNATFTAVKVPPGGLAVCSQSGALGIALLGRARAWGLGVSSFASLGNRADVSTNDLLELWEEDDRTAAVLLYVENFGNPDRFSRIARRVSRRKPILAVKGRRSAHPTAEAQSHTAAALRDEAVVDTLLRHAGILRFHSGEHLFDAARFFESQPLPRGRRVGIVSNSTGLATLAVDASVPRGLVVEAAPVILGIHAGPADYASAIGELLAGGRADAIMAYYVDLTGGDPEAVLEAVSQTAEGQGIPVVASVVDADGNLPPAARHRVPNMLFPEACGEVLARAVERRTWLSRPLGLAPSYEGLDAEAARSQVAARLGGAGEGWLTTPEAESLLATHGIDFVPSRRCADVEGAVAAARAIGGPVALKADFPPPAHAGDIDAVLLGIAGDEAIRSGWTELERRVRAAGREWAGLLIQPLVGGGADVLVGSLTDPDLGPVMAIGLGGRTAGLAGDVAFRPLPLTDVDAREIVAGSPGVATRLRGFRGSPALDAEALHVLVLRFAALLQAVPEVVEADLNPVRCMAHGCTVLDLRLRLERRQPVERVRTW
jgi:acetate---CoA ligase (ADP-forming)